MKVLLYNGLSRFATKSGIGEAIRHQEKFFNLLDLPYTKNIKDSFDIIQLNTIFPDSLFISHWGKLRNKKIIYYAHSTMEDFRNSFKGSNWLAPLFKRWIIHCYNSGDIILTPTDYSKSILESYGLKKPIYSLSNGIDTNFFCPNEKMGFSFREKYNISSTQKVIISVGHYIERKGILDFIELAKLMPEYQFIWFGYTNLNLVPKNIKIAIKSASTNVRFPGYVDKNELKSAFSGADLFLFMSYEETEGIALLEALSSKIPVLIRDIPIYKKWLIENQDVYKALTLTGFKDKTEKILNKELEDLTSNAYKVAAERDLDNISKKLLNIYSK
ncbi:MAG: glycosyltransferase family 4 protein [Spirochaetaceae bacterium]|nr:glycosyltransferase family 4 protein [Spirochaetaceae bacterium]